MYIVARLKKEFDEERRKIENDAKTFLSWGDQAGIQLYYLYKLENADQAEQRDIASQLFDKDYYQLSFDLPDLDKDRSFIYSHLPGQYSDHEAMLQGLISNFLGYDQISVQFFKLIEIQGLDEEQIKEFKDYLINPLENRIIDLEKGLGPFKKPSEAGLERVEGFRSMDQTQLRDLAGSLSMDKDDLALCQDYFVGRGRDPRFIELQLINTYWSDHCRHRTFNTAIEEIEIEDGPYKALFQLALDNYMEKRLYLARDQGPVTLMDLATIQGKYLKERGLLEDWEISDEINACALEIELDVDGSREDWVLYFKNETHNHPTEIEPYGGASTCIGGGIRDPLSGRSWVYQAMRISAGKDPTLGREEKHPAKLDQRTIAKKALEGSSDYANQIGLTGSFVEEVYHPGFEAKRMEVAALLAAGPRESITRARPRPGDRILLLGGKTGRDGLGAAVGSSQVLTDESSDDLSIQVQKGAPSVQRKIMRLFRNRSASKLIKACNDLGAGGISVAIGELAAGVEIDLDRVPVKYPGMDGAEIALSESQERMALVLDESDVEEYLAYAKEEDVEASIIARVSEDPSLRMYWQDQLIVDLDHDFLDSGGSQKSAWARLVQARGPLVNGWEDMPLSQAGIEAYMSDLNRADQRGLAESFDGSIGRASVFYPYGGKHRLTKELAMVSRLPVPGGKTSCISAMAYGYHPHLASQSPFHGAYYAVVESVSRLVALGLDYKDVRLSFQEYFEDLKADPNKWGKPVMALLGANAAMDGLDLASIGGKDSMSGSYEEMDVPPSLISFAIAPGRIDRLMSRAFKRSGSDLVLIESKVNEDQTLDLAMQCKIYERIHQLIKDKEVLAISTVGFDGILKDLIEMALGNGLGLDLDLDQGLTKARLGSFILEIPHGQDLAQLFQGLDYQVLGRTSDKEGLLKIKDLSLDLGSIYQASKEVLDGIYRASEEKSFQPQVRPGKTFTGKYKHSKPRALVVSLLGSNGEYDMVDALRAAGFTSKRVLIKDSSKEAMEESIENFLEDLAQAQLLALANGPAYANVLSPGKAWQLFLTRGPVKEAIHSHLDDQRLICANGTAFIGLIRTGLIEHGQINNKSGIRPLANKDMKFISDIYSATVISAASAFSSQSLGLEYRAPLAGKYLSLDLGDQEEELLAKGQVISVFNRHPSQCFVDSLASPDGLVFGSLSSFDRLDEGLFQNIGEGQDPSFLKEARNYFS